MRDRAGPDIGDDLHVPMRMRVEPGARRDLVVVPDPQRPEPHAARIVVAAEAEMMPGFSHSFWNRPRLANGRTSIMIPS